jgi:hypothetical protein
MEWLIRTIYKITLKRKKDKQNMEREIQLINRSI